MLRRAAKIIARSIGDIELNIIYSSRRTLGISILPDSTVLIRVPFRTPDSSVERIVRKKYSWIKKHRDNFLRQKEEAPSPGYANGERHFFRGSAFILDIGISNRPSVSFIDGVIRLRLKNPDDKVAVKKLLYRGYMEEAAKLFPGMVKRSLDRYSNYGFVPSSLVIRNMRRRWGSCSANGKITLSTELIKLSDIYTDYVIAHELCHLKHHNHGEKFYALLSEIFPDWKKFRSEMRHLHT